MTAGLESARSQAAIPYARVWRVDVLESGPALLAVGVFLWWTAMRGGFATTSLTPGALVLFAALLVLVAARPERAVSIPRLLLTAAVLGALFGLVTLLAIFWAEAPGEAWTGANRTIVYAAAFALFALTPFRPRSLSLVLGIWATGVAAVTIAALMGATTGGELEAVFQDRGRLAQPIGYANATCALLLMAFWPAAVIASRRQVPIAARALLLGVAFVLADLAVLTQSRVSVLALPVAALVAFAVVPGRVRLLLTLVPIAVAVALTLDPMLSVFDAGAEARPEALDRALRAFGAGFVAVSLTGAALAFVDARTRVSRAAARRADLVLAGVAVAVAVVGVSTIAVTSDPVARGQAAWDEFTSGDRPRVFEETRFTAGGLGDYRHDYWRVALRQFREEPLLGAGADNFAAAYLRERSADRSEAKFPHSAPLAILSSTGLVGAALFLGFLACALASYLRARRTDRFAAAVGGAGVLVFVYWFVHGSADWFWEIPALGAPAIAFLGAAAALPRSPADDGASAKPPRGSLRVAAGAILVAAAALAAAALTIPPWLSAREVAAATTGWRANPEASFAALDRASRLNPLSERADLIAGAIANRTGQHDRARTLLIRAIERNPVNWYAQLELAIAEAELEHRDLALRAVARARELNPKEEVIEVVGIWLSAGEPIDIGRIDGIFRERIFPERLRSQTR